MFAAGHEPQTEFRFVQRDVGGDKCDHGNEHEPIEFKLTDLDDKRLLRKRVLDDGRNVVGVCGGIDGFHNNSCGGGAENVQRRTDNGLIRFAVDRRDSQQTGVEKTCEHADENDENNDQERRRSVGQVAHGQRTAQRADDHDALKTEVDDAGMLGKTAAQRYEQENRGKQQRVLNEKDHS